MLRLGKLVFLGAALWWIGTNWVWGDRDRHDLSFRVDVSDVQGTGLSISITRVSTNGALARSP